MHFKDLKNDPRMPKHIGLIIDGNGRWALKRCLKRSYGHSVGAINIKKQIKNIQELGIKNLSVYAFSQQNWNRPKEEIEFLFKTFNTLLDDFIKEYLDKDVRFIISGNLDDSRIDEELRTKAKYLIEKTKNKSSFILNICLNYGGREEILRAVNNIIKDKLTNVDEITFEKYLYTADLLPLDFVIRTSGEKRTSNFLLWQAIYSEWYFPKIMWPDFRKKDLIKALKVYMKRNRRFGSIKG